MSTTDDTITLTFDAMAALEPGLTALRDAVASGMETMTTIMLAGKLVPLVGSHAGHARLRAPGCYATAYDELARVYQERRARAPQ